MDEAGSQPQKPGLGPSSSTCAHLGRWCPTLSLCSLVLRVGVQFMPRGLGGRINPPPNGHVQREPRVLEVSLCGCC